MSGINKRSIIAMMVVYGIARGTMDNIKESDGEEGVATDTTVFNEAMSAIAAKEAEVNNGK